MTFRLARPKIRAAFKPAGIGSRSVAYDVNEYNGGFAIGPGTLLERLGSAIKNVSKKKRH